MGILLLGTPAVAVSQFSLILNFSSSTSGAPQSFIDAANAAAEILRATILDAITVRLKIGYGEWDDGLLSVPSTSAVGADLTGSFTGYPALRTALLSRSVSADDASFCAALPATSSLQGVSTFYVPAAIAKAIGLTSPTQTAVDGAVGVGVSVPTNALVGVFLHEMTHALGRENGVAPFDFGRFASAGTRVFSSGGTSASAYFSVDGGTTDLADYGTTSDPGDMNNSVGTTSGFADCFNEFYSAGTTDQFLTALDKRQLDVLGFQVAP